jgi:radical SAM superfamily enzyme YgiQ (UPF0313 family)
VTKPNESLAETCSVLLVSCYELGHQPFTLASAWAELEIAGHRVEAFDTSLDALDLAAVARARLVVISVPMLTALRLGARVAEQVRALNPEAHICLLGLYAWMNAREVLRDSADSVIGGEFERALVELAGALAAQAGAARSAAIPAIGGVTTRKTLEETGRVALPILEKLEFHTPRRAGLPALDRYAKLLGPAEGEQRSTGYVEASRGCKHRCRHCPIVPVYDGRFFVVDADIVLADAAQQIATGARHLTFGDPDFLNGVRHSMRIVRELHARHPEVTFDVTIKVEHVLAHREVFPELRALGCVFVVSALESLSDRVLHELDKGHTRADILEALSVLRAAGLPLRPSFVPFSPWATLEDYIDLLEFVFAERLTESVDPIQLAIRLLFPNQTALLWPRGGPPRPAGSAAAQPIEAEPPRWLGEYDASELGYRWRHEDPRMDALHADVSRVVERGAEHGRPNHVVLAEIRELAYAAAGRDAPPLPPVEPSYVPRLSEAWFCCAEPSGSLLERVSACSEEKRSGCSA